MAGNRMPAGALSLAIAAVGLEPAKAHWLTRPGVWENFGTEPTTSRRSPSWTRNCLTGPTNSPANYWRPHMRHWREQEGEDFLCGLAAMKSLLPVPQFPG